MSSVARDECNLAVSEAKQGGVNSGLQSRVNSEDFFSAEEGKGVGLSGKI